MKRTLGDARERENMVEGMRQGDSRLLSLDSGQGKRVKIFQCEKIS